MSVGHSHRELMDRRHVRPLAISFGLVVAFMIVEFVVGFMSGSLALTADAGHMATDALGLGMALAAAVAAGRTAPGGHRTYGLYRLEILAALANAVLLVAVAGYIIFEAVQRLREPAEVLAGPVLIVGAVGLAVNVGSWRLLREGAGNSLNVQGAYLDVLSDMLASIGVVVAAIVLLVTGWSVVDSLVGIAIGLFILPRAWVLAGRAIRILTEAAPAHLDVDDVSTGLASIPGVIDVHDLHVWTLTSDMDAATAHLVVAEGTDSHPVLDQARDVLTRDFGIAHATVQVEPDTHEGCDEISW